HMTRRRVFLVVALFAAILAPLAPAADVPVSGNRIRLVDRGGANRRVFVGLSGPAIHLTGLDPTLTRASLELFSLVTGTDVVIPLPASNWTNRGGQFRYKDRNATATSARLVGGQAIRVSTHGSGAYALGGQPQGTVNVLFTIGTTRFCASF